MPLNSKTTDTKFKDAQSIARTIISAAFWQILGGSDKIFPGCIVLATIILDRICGTNGALSSERRSALEKARKKDFDKLMENYNEQINAVRNISDENERNNITDSIDNEYSKLLNDLYRRHNDIYNDYELEYNRGFAKGNDTGYYRGFYDGNDYGHEIGFATGNVTGYEEGFSAGNASRYEDGQKDCAAKNTHDDTTAIIICIALSVALIFSILCTIYMICDKYRQSTDGGINHAQHINSDIDNARQCIKIRMSNDSVNRCNRAKEGGNPKTANNEPPAISIPLLSADKNLGHAAEEEGPSHICTDASLNVESNRSTNSDHATAREGKRAKINRDSNVASIELVPLISGENSGNAIEGGSQSCIYLDVDENSDSAIDEYLDHLIKEEGPENDMFFDVLASRALSSRGNSSRFHQIHITFSDRDIARIARGENLSVNGTLISFATRKVKGSGCAEEENGPSGACSNVSPDAEWRGDEDSHGAHR